MAFLRKKYDYDLIIIGSGAGGSVGAHYARTLGKSVAMFEMGTIGGECPNFACVPTKALLHTAEKYRMAKDLGTFGVHAEHVSFNFHAIQRYKDMVVMRTGATHGEESFKRDGIDLIKEKASFVSPHEVIAGGKVYSASKFVIATGSKVFIPPIPGLDQVGYMTFKEAVDLKELPKTMLIFGGGVVACEFAHIFSSFGTKVTIVNRSEKLLGKEDTESSDLIQALFEQQGITIMTNTIVTRVEENHGRKVVHLQKGNKQFFEEIDAFLIATGKVPVMDFAPEKAGLAVSHHRLVLNKHLQTSVPHIFAAGDIAGPLLFTHTGYYQSTIAVHNAFSRNKQLPDYRSIPRCVFVTPEVASVGLTEKEAIDKGIKIRKGIAPIAILGRANTSNELDGFVKVITDKNDVIIGASIVAPRAGEMIHELALAVKLRVKAATLAEMVHAYPTFSEAVKIACSVVE